MRAEKLDIIITILASLIVAIISFVNGSKLFEMIFRLIIAIIIFYIIGFFMKMYVQGKILKNNNGKAAENDDLDKAQHEDSPGEKSVYILDDINADNN